MPFTYICIEIRDKSWCVVNKVWVTTQLKRTLLAVPAGCLPRGAAERRCTSTNVRGWMQWEGPWAACSALAQVERQETRLAALDKYPSDVDFQGIPKERGVRASTLRDIEGRGSRSPSPCRARSIPDYPTVSANAVQHEWEDKIAPLV